MYDFFDFTTNISKEYVFNNWGIEHISAILIVTIVIFFCLRILKKLSKEKQTRIIKICAILVPFVEISHNVWLYFANNSSIIELLSLHLCGLQMYFIPLAVFTNFIVFKDFIFATSILGGIFGILFPSGVTGSYPFWHFQTIQTLIYHSLLIFIPLAILVTTDYRPTLKRFYKVLLLFFIVVIICVYIDLVYGQNYLFLVTAPEMALLTNIQTKYGTFPYLCFTFLVLLFICVFIHLPFDLKRKKNNIYGDC